MGDQMLNITAVLRDKAQPARMSVRNSRKKWLHQDDEQEIEGSMEGGGRGLNPAPFFVCNKVTWQVSGN